MVATLYILLPIKIIVFLKMLKLYSWLEVEFDTVHMRWWDINILTLRYENNQHIYVSRYPLYYEQLHNNKYVPRFVSYTTISLATCHPQLCSAFRFSFKFILSYVHHLTHLYDGSIDYVVLKIKEYPRLICIFSFGT